MPEGLGQHLRLVLTGGAAHGLERHRRRSGDHGFGDRVAGASAPDVAQPVEIGRAWDEAAARRQPAVATREAAAAIVARWHGKTRVHDEIRRGRAWAATTTRLDPFHETVLNGQCNHLREASEL